MIAIQISELARKTGVSLRSLRYYEEKKLLRPNRSENGYRQYSDIDVEQIQMIQLYLSIGLTTTEIADLFRCSTKGQIKQTCIRTGIEKGKIKLTEIREQIEILHKAELQLINMMEDLKAKLHQETIENE